VVDGLPAVAARQMPLVVDVETVANAIDMAPSNVRRNMEGLVRDGLAWPTQTAPSAKGGRPKHVYRLVTEKLQ
jgi:predicted ArsR family transcriptional regulator